MFRFFDRLSQNNAIAAERKPAVQGKGRLQRFMRDSRGSAALEFAMIAPWFFLLLFSMFEVGMTYTVNEVLQNAVNEAARQIRTGQVQTDSTMTPSKFKALVCTNLNQMFDCTQLGVSVQTFASYTSVDYSSPLDANGNMQTSFPFVPGNPGDIVLVRGYYPWSPLTYGLGSYLISMANNKELLQAAAVFRNEPYQP